MFANIDTDLFEKATIDTVAILDHINSANGYKSLNEIIESHKFDS